MATNVNDPFLGFDSTGVTSKCFLAMLANPSWFNLAQNLTGGGNAAQILASIATMATQATQALETQLKNTTTI